MGMPPAGSDSAAHLYRGEPGRDYHDRKRALPEKALPWIMRLRAAKLQHHIALTDVVFEFGAGSGWNLGCLNCASRKGYDAADFLRDRIIAAGAEFIPDPSLLPEGSIDVAILHHTLEHLLNPSECLWELRRILKAEGKLIIHSPWERQRRFSRYRRSEPNHHLYTWNAQTLANLANACGYTVSSVKIRSYGYDRFAANLAVKFRLGERGFRLLRHFLILLRPETEVELVAMAKKPGQRK
jgi:SAM-dependent methyltransferase